jgi:hypothetical protein
MYDVRGLKIRIVSGKRARSVADCGVAQGLDLQMIWERYRLLGSGMSG